MSLNSFASINFLHGLDDLFVLHVFGTSSPAAGRILRRWRIFMSYNFACDWQAAIIMDPLKPHQVGYLTEFNGIGLSAPLAKDLQVQCPYSNLTAPAYQGLGFNFPVNQGPIVAPT